MGRQGNWLKRVRRKFQRSNRKDIIFLHSNTSPTHDDEEEEDEKASLTEETAAAAALPTLGYQTNKVINKEDIAVTKIQACFRGHLARRAFRALKSLVKLQALARGVCVRRQTRIALHFMHALVRLQVRVRARQLLAGSIDH